MQECDDIVSPVEAAGSKKKKRHVFFFFFPFFLCPCPAVAPQSESISVSTPAACGGGGERPLIRQLPAAAASCAADWHSADVAVHRPTPGLSEAAEQKKQNKQTTTTRKQGRTVGMWCLRCWAAARCSCLCGKDPRGKRFVCFVTWNRICCVRTNASSWRSALAAGPAPVATAN